jgi:hypothetical protein
MVTEYTVNGKKINTISPNHYAKYKIEPISFIVENELDYCQGNIIKYIMRYKDKNGLEDLYKAEWYIKELIRRNERK